MYRLFAVVMVALCGGFALKNYIEQPMTTTLVVLIVCAAALAGSLVMLAVSFVRSKRNGK